MTEIPGWLSTEIRNEADAQFFERGKNGFVPSVHHRIAALYRGHRTNFMRCDPLYNLKSMGYEGKKNGQTAVSDDLSVLAPEPGLEPGTL